MPQLVVTSPGKDPRTYELDKPKLLIGRDPACDIHIDNLAVSRRHVELSQQGEAFVAKDLETANKTFVNGQEIKEHVLKDGDEIFIGNYKLKFVDPKAAAKPEAPKPPPPPEEFNEPTFVLPPEVVRKKLQELGQMPPQVAASAPPPAAKPLDATLPDKPQTGMVPPAPATPAAPPPSAAPASAPATTPQPRPVPVAAAPVPAAPVGAPAPAKKNNTMLIVAGVGCFLLFMMAIVAAALVYFLWIKK